MSDPKNFLTRWSRRKQATANEKARPEQPAAPDADKPLAPGEDAHRTDAAASRDAANAPAVPEFDLSKLPSLDSIGANSDITAFMQAGVPAALRHAALRRAWVADPAIRDFIGPSENAWDFTDPTAMPGFGELDPQLDIKKLVAEIFRDAEPETKSPADSTPPLASPEPATQLPDQSDTTPGIPAASEPLKAESQQVATSNRDALLQRNENAATQHENSQQEPVAMKARRHGSAMPQ